MSAQIFLGLHERLPDLQIVETSGPGDLMTRLGNINTTSVHQFLTVGTVGGETGGIIVDSTYLQFFTRPPTGLPPVFVGTREQLIEIFAQYPNLMKNQAMGSPTVNATNFVDYFWGFGSNARRRVIVGGRNASPDVGVLKNDANPMFFESKNKADPTLHVLARVQNRVLKIDMRSAVADVTPARAQLGPQKFREALAHFQGRFDQISLTWDEKVPERLTELNRLTSPPSSLSLEQAIARTWIGREAAAAGFPGVSVTRATGSPGHYTLVEPRFSK
jgi:hypothetical protein